MMPAVRLVGAGGTWRTVVEIVASSRWLPGALIAGYFAVMTLQVAIVRDGGRTDGGEAMLLAQSLEWGYETKNPPLFYWLTWLAEQVAGPSPAVVFLLRMSFMILLYLGTLRLARQLRSDPVLALGAGLAPLAVPQYNWYAVYDLTHTAIAGAAYVWCLVFVIALERKRHWSTYLALFGTLTAGLYGKYIFAAWLAALLPAMLANPRFRLLLRDPLLWLVLGGALLALAPHLSWMLDHQQALAEQMARSMGIAPSSDTGSTAAGWRSLAKALGELFVFPFGIVLLLAFRGSLFARSRADDDRHSARLRLVRDLTVFTLGLLVIGALIGVRRIEPHHLFTLVPAAVWLVARLDPGSTSAAAPGRLVALIVLGLAVAMAAFTPNSLQKARQLRCGRCSEFLPYQDYARGLREAGFRAGTLVSLSPRKRLNSAALRAHIEGLRVLSPDYPLYRPPANAGAGDCAVVWLQPDDAEIARLLAQGGTLPGAGGQLPGDMTVGSIGGTLRLTGQSAPDLRFIRVPGGVGDCR